MIYKIIICLQHIKKQRKNKERKKKGNVLEAFGPGWGSEPSTIRLVALYSINNIMIEEKSTELEEK